MKSLKPFHLRRKSGTREISPNYYKHRIKGTNVTMYRKLILKEALNRLPINFKPASLQSFLRCTVDGGT